MACQWQPGGYSGPMSPNEPAAYATVKIKPAARTAATSLAYALTGNLSQRISQAQAIHVACLIAARHIDECVYLISQETRA